MACCQQWLKKNGGILLWGIGVFVFLIDLLLWADQLNEWSRNHAHLIKMLAAFAPAIIAGIAVMIANRQHHTAVNKLKLDLFEKRFELYKQIESYLNEVVFHTQNTTSDDLNDKMDRIIVLARFLFKNSQIEAWLKELQEKSIQYYWLERDLEKEYSRLKMQGTPNDSPVWERHVEKENECRTANKLLYKNLEKLPEKLQPLIAIEAY